MLRRLLTDLEGWREGRGGARAASISGSAALATTLGRRRGVRVLLVEMAPGSRFPHYAERARGRRDLRWHRDVVVFCDAAHRRQVWTWRTSFARGTAHSEEEPATAERRRAVAERATSVSPDGCARSDPPGPLIRKHLAHTLLPSAVAPESRRSGRLVRTIEESDCPRFAAEAWRALTGLRLLDPDCGDGSWLVDAMLTLEPLYAAVIRRLEGWRREAHAATQTGRSGRPRSRQDPAGSIPHPSEASGIRRRIVHSNLYGAAATPQQVAITRARLELAMGCGSSPAECPALEHHLVVGEAREGVASEDELRLTLEQRDVSPAHVEELCEEAASAARIAELLAAADLEGTASTKELRAAHRALAERKIEQTGLVRALAPDLEATLLHPHLQWPEVTSSGGFIMVRGVR